MGLSPIEPSVLWLGVLHVVCVHGGPFVFPVVVDVVLIPIAPPVLVLGRLRVF